MLLAFFALGVLLGGLVNWATYSLAWSPRPISPWAPPPDKGPPRRWTDRLPIIGWWSLRREASIHGRGFWIRPLAVELGLGLGLAALGWWEIGERGLSAGQWRALASLGAAPRGIMAPEWTAWCAFGGHVALIVFMAAASLIDIDEKIIPDTITVPGTLLGLLLAMALPMSLLPHCEVRAIAPPAGVKAILPGPGGAANSLGGAQAYVEPLTPVSPLVLPRAALGAPRWQGLALGWGCYMAWCVALAPRVWRGRRGWRAALQVIARRVVRELMRPPLVWIGVGGLAVILGAWSYGGAPWVGLFSALVGSIGGGALVWCVRLIGSAALRREAMGFGDVTLMMMVGAYLGWQACVIVFFVAPFAGLAAGVLQAVLRRDDAIPYGPFLCLGSLLVLVRWGDIWRAGGLQDLFGVPGLVPAALAICMVLLGGLLLVWRQIKEGVRALNRHA